MLDTQVKIEIISEPLLFFHWLPFAPLNCSNTWKWKINKKLKFVVKNIDTVQ